MNKAPSASGRIADNRVMAHVGRGLDARSAIACLALGLSMTGRAQVDFVLGRHFGSGLRGIALPCGPQPHARPARARFAHTFRAGRVPDRNAGHQAGRGDDDVARAH
jgi:hypothetical protein